MNYTPAKLYTLISTQICFIFDTHSHTFEVLVRIQKRIYVIYLQKHRENDLKMKIIWLSCTYNAEIGTAIHSNEKILHKNEIDERALKLMIF